MSKPVKRIQSIPSPTTDAVPSVGDGIPVRVTKECPSLSGRTVLTYQIGLSADGEHHLRLSSNTGGGFFSPTWIPFSVLLKTACGRAKEKPITSSFFESLFSGKSVNTSGFLLAVLKQEGVVCTLEGNKRSYGFVEDEVMAERFKQIAATAPSAKAKRPVTPAPLPPSAAATSAT